MHEGAETLADLADLDLDVLLQRSGLAEVADEIALEPAPEFVPPPFQVGALFADAVIQLDPRRRTVALKRTFARKPQKLETLGTAFGVSRERARQLEANLRFVLDEQVGDQLRKAAQWMQTRIGPAAAEEEFARVLAMLVGDAPKEFRVAAEVALMAVADYQRLEGGVGDLTFLDLVDRVRSLAPTWANDAGIVDEEALQEAAAGGEAPGWDLAVRNAGLVRIDDYLMLRDTRRARVFATLETLGEPVTRPDLAKAAGLPDNTTLSSLLSSDPLFARLTKDKWGLVEWTDNPYEGVVAELVKRIERAGGAAPAEDLLREIPDQFEVLPATVRNYLATRKFEVRDGMVRVVKAPFAPKQPLSKARDVVQTPDGEPALQLVVGDHHLKGNSQKVSMAVAQHFGVGPDCSAKIPFAEPPGVDDASMIWRSYDPNGPEMGRLREAMEAVGAVPGDVVTVILRTDGLRMVREVIGGPDLAPYSG